MKKVTNPNDTSRTSAFEMWMNSPMPMLTLVKTIDVTKAVKYCKRNSLSFNMLLCWCIGKAASRIEEFYLLPGENEMYRFDELAISLVISNIKGGINYCDIPFYNDLQQFNAAYQQICERASAQCENICLDEQMMVIGTSGMLQTELDCVVNQYAKGLNNPMVMWGKYRKGWFKTTLPISFQFHHVQMDGGHAARFLKELQKAINDRCE